MLTNKELAKMFLPKVEIEEISEKEKKIIEEYEKRRIEEIMKKYGLVSVNEYLALEKIARYFIGKDVDEMIKERRIEIKNGYVTVLNLRRLNLKYLPEEIGGLENLEELNAISNQIKELPKSIGNLRKLRVLKLNSNELKYLPEEIGGLENLEELNAISNQIEELPKSIGNLRNLRELYVRDNPLNEFSKKLLEELKERGIDIKWCIRKKYDVIL